MSDPGHAPDDAAIDMDDESRPSPTGPAVDVPAGSTAAPADAPIAPVAGVHGRLPSAGVRNLSRGTVLASELETADGLWAKFLGLMGRPTLPDGACLWLPESNGIHMMFMRFPIDAVFVGRPDGDDGARPGAVRPPRTCPPGAGSSRWSAAPTACWSCPSGTIAATGTMVGDRLLLA